MSLKPEQILHINYINWFNYEFPELEDDLHHFANERKCSPQQGALLKRMGVKAGVYDLFLGVPDDVFHGFWLELKCGSKLSPAQKAFGARKMMRGYFCAVAYDLVGAKELTRAYLKDYRANSVETNLKNGTNN